MSQITSILPKADYKLEVFLDNESSITLNMKNRLQTVRFGMLEDEEFFKLAATDGCCIRWGNDIEISLTEVFELAQK